jgi:hypothetical protein
MIGGNVTEDPRERIERLWEEALAEEREKITPETYKNMNKEFEEEGIAFRIKVPTQEEIDDWRQRD